MDDDLLFESLRDKRIAVKAAASVEPEIAQAMRQTRLAFALVNGALAPDAAELDRFDAVILAIDGAPTDSPWLRPDLLRGLKRPLLLAGPPEEIYCRESLQALADDAILMPFAEREVLYRLHRITGGKATSRKAVIRSSRPIVLVADDDRNITNYLEAVFKNLNAEVYFAADGKEALGLARELLPDLVLLDIRLPGMSGLEVLRYLRADPGTKGLAAVMLTASSDPGHVRRGASLGVLDYILKPFGHIELVRKLKALLPGAPQRMAAIYPTLPANPAR